MHKGWYLEIVALRARHASRRLSLPLSLQLSILQYKTKTRDRNAGTPITMQRRTQLRVLRLLFFCLFVVRNRMSGFLIASARQSSYRPHKERKCCQMAVQRPSDRQFGENTSQQTYRCSLCIAHCSSTTEKEKHSIFDLLVSRTPHHCGRRSAVSSTRVCL